MTRLLLVCATMVSPLALAEGPSPLVESGAYVGMGVGALYSAAAPSSPGTNFWGQGVSLEARWAPITRLSVSVLMFASIFDAPATYQAGASGRGDFISISPAAAIRVNTFGFDDRWGVRRLWVYLRAGGGYSLFWPKTTIAQGSPLLLGGLGVEYRTHFRHFSVGLEGLVTYQTALGALNIAITPLLQFAF